MEKALGLLRRSYRETDLSSSPLPWGGDLSKEEGLRGGGSPGGALGRYLHTCSCRVSGTGTLSQLISSYVTFAYKNPHRLSQDFPLHHSCVFAHIRMTSPLLVSETVKYYFNQGTHADPFATLFSQPHKEFQNSREEKSEY